jgi:hypothetical protein
MIGSTNAWRWAALAFCVVLSAVVMWAPGPDRTLRSSVAIHDFGHVVVFGLVAALLAFALSIRSRETLLRRLATTCLAAIAAVSLGAVVELAQAASGGNGDPWDIVRDGGGALSVALLLIAWDPALSIRASAVIGTVAASTLIAFASPILVALQDEARARTQFPVLASFESTSELSRFLFQQGSRPRIVPITDGQGRAASGVQLHLPPGSYPGFGLSYFPRDWRGMRALRLLIANPEPTPVELTVRIDDKQYGVAFHDRFNQAFHIQPGTNQIEIPLQDVLTAPRERQFNLERVESLLVFAVDLAKQREIVVGPIVLVR